MSTDPLKKVGDAGSIQQPTTQPAKKELKLKDVEKKADIIAKQSFEIQQELNELYESLIHQGATPINLSKLKKEIDDLKQGLADLEKSITLYKGKDRSNEVRAKIYQAKQRLQTVNSKHKRLEKMIAKDSVLPKAFQLRAEINNLMREIDKSSNKKKNTNRIKDAIKKYSEFKKVLESSSPSEEQERILTRELEILRLKMVSLQERGKFEAKLPAPPLSAVQEKRTLSDIKESVINLRNNQELSTEEKKFSKVSVGGFFARIFKNKKKLSQLKDVAGKVEMIGHDALRAMKYLDKQMVEISLENQFDSEELELVVKNLENLSKGMTERLNALEEELVSIGYDRTGEKIEKVIAKERNLLATVRDKTKVLRNNQYLNAIKTYTEGMTEVTRLQKVKSGRGVAFFRAQVALESMNGILKESSLPEDLKKEIIQLRDALQKHIDHSKGLLKLTKGEIKAYDNCSKALLLGNFSNLTDKDKRKFQDALAKKLALTRMMPESDRKNNQVIALLQQLELARSNQPKFYEESTTQIKELVDRFKEDFSDSQLETAVKGRNQLRWAFIEASKKENQPRKWKFVYNNVSPAMNAIRNAMVESKDSLIPLVLKKAQNDISHFLDKSLVLDKESKKLKQDILQGRIPKNLKQHQINYILNIELARYFSTQNEEQKKLLQFEITQLLVNLAQFNPEMFNDLKADETRTEMLDKFLSEYKEGVNEQGNIQFQNPFFHKYQVIEDALKKIRVGIQVAGKNAKNKDKNEFKRLEKLAANLLNVVDDPQKLRKTFQAAFELFSTEQSFNRDMKELLKRLKKDHPSMQKEIKMLSEMIELNDTFLKKLSQNITGTEINPEGLEELFKSPAFIANIQKMAEWVDVYMDFAKRPDLKDLTGELIKPTQRMMRYQLLLKELAERMPENQKDHVQKAFEAAESEVREINENVRKEK